MHVFARNGSIIYYSLLDVLRRGHSISDITLISSPGVDPRAVPLFKDVIFFNRPSLSTRLLFLEQDYESMLPQAGPQVINAALEFCLELGCKNFYLFGCDFSAERQEAPRSKSAFGFSMRELNLPVSSQSGSTIFTDAELLVTADYFNKMLGLYQAQAITQSNSVLLSNVIYQPSLSCDDILQNSSSKDLRSLFNQAISAHTSDLSLTSLRDRMIREIKNAPQIISSLKSQLNSILSNTDQWDRNTQVKINQLLSYNDFTMIRMNHDLF